jgi:hypothetical protein
MGMDSVRVSDQSPWVGPSNKEVTASLYQFNRNAREFSFAFVERVLRDEESGALLQNVAMHDEWHELADRFDRLILMAYPESGKTNSIIIGRALWELGRDPSLRCIFLSKTYGQAEKITRTMRSMIDHSEELRAVFPKLRAGDKWTDGQFTVARPFISKTPSVQALGFRGAITGSRVDRLYIDDLEDDDNTRTPSRRADTLRWLDTTVFSRMTQRGRVVWATNAWHPKDAAHTLASRRRWNLRQYPVEADGVPTFPQKYPASRIARLREELTPRRFAQVYLNQSTIEGAGEFQQEMVDRSKALGRGLVFRHSMEPERGSFIVCGVDLATGRRKREGDETVITVVHCEPARDRRQILGIEAGRWQGPEILRRLADVYQRYGCPAIVEDNAAQIYLLQFAEQMRSVGLVLPPIVPWTTGTNKWDPIYGVASLAVEMQRGGWVFPCDEPRPGCPIEELQCPDELEKLIQDMLDFTPTRHTGDRLMSLWFAREGVRRFAGSAGGAGTSKPRARSEVRGAGGF